MIQRSTLIVLLGLGAALVLLPLSLGIPGLPMSLRADETSHYFLARSLAFDGDSVVDAVDIDRIFREMPFAGSEHLALGSDDGWQSARWAVSPLYSTLLVPAAALTRTNGAFAFNAVCFMLAFVLLSRATIRRFRLGADESRAWVIVGAALVLSGAFVNVWWIHPATLRLLLVSAAFSLGWSTDVDPARHSSLRSGLRMAAAGACLGLCIAEVPWLAVLLPALLARHRSSLRRSAALTAGAVTGVAAALLVGWLVLGHFAADDFAAQAVFEVHTPDELPWLDLPDDPDHGVMVVDGLQPVPGLLTFAERLALSVVGRRRGLLLLFPFAALFVAAAFRRRRAPFGPATTRSGDVAARLLLGAGLSALVLVRPFAVASLLDLERYGDPVLASVWPAFFFLPAALPGVLATLVAVAVSAFLLLPTILTPLGPAVPFPEAHHAARGHLLQRLPMDLREVSQAAGWTVFDLGGPPEESLRLWAPSYVSSDFGDSVALLGTERAELWVESKHPIAGLNLDLSSFAPGNRVTFEFAAGRQEYTFTGEGLPDRTRVRLPLPEGWRPARRVDGTEVWITRVIATTSTGERPNWRAHIPDSYYVGAHLTILGSDETVSRDVWHVEWAACGAPPKAAPGESIKALVRLRNTSSVDWITDGPARVRLAHRWLGEGGRVIESPTRTDFAATVPSGQEVFAWVAAEAPKTPGIWRLEVEPIYELVGWFKDHLEPDAAVCRAEIRVER